MPPSMAEWLPVEHPVWFVIETISDLAPELKGFHARPVLGGTGRAAYDPMMLVTLLAYASWQGVRSSRHIEARCHTDVAFRIVCGQDPPDHSTIARFRRANAARFADLFTQILLLCARAGMGRFGKVAIDGTKIAGNASRDANVTLDRIRAVAAAEVDAGLAADADEEADDDATPPPALRDRTKRRERLRRVREELEAEQARLDQADAQQRARAEQHLADVAAGTNGRGRAPAGADAVQVARARLERERAAQQAKIDEYGQERVKSLQERTRNLTNPPSPVDRAARVRRAAQALARAEHAAQAGPGAVSPDATSGRAKPTRGEPDEDPARQAKRNVTDCDSRLMPTRNGWVQGYNVQAAVTEDHVIVAVTIGNEPGDVGQAVPMMQATQAAADAIAEHTGADTTIGDVLMDAGYDSRQNVEAPGPPRLIANSKRRVQGRAAKTKPASGSPPAGATARQAMDHRLRTPEGIATYRRRGAIVEPMFGYLKDILGLRRFLTRGLTNVAGEINLAFATLNLRRLHTHIAHTAGAW